MFNLIVNQLTNTASQPDFNQVIITKLLICTIILCLLAGIKIASEKGKSIKE